MKKQNYVSTISEVEKYLQSLSIVLSELNGQIKIAREDRVEFSKFLEKYKDKVIKFSSSMPLISPYDWKHTVYLLTKYYPELVEDTYPWNENRDFSKLILMTYHKVKYRTCFRRLISGYYCYSSCCKSEEEGVRNIREYFYKKKRIEESKYLNEIEEKYNNMNHTNKDKHSSDDVPINIPNDGPVKTRMNESAI
jgi:type III secretory pathway component EscR